MSAGRSFLPYLLMMMVIFSGAGGVQAMTLTSQESYVDASAESVSDSAATSDLSPINISLAVEWTDPAPVIPMHPSTASSNASLVTSLGASGLSVSTETGSSADWQPGQFFVAASTDVDLTIEFTLPTAESMTWSSYGGAQFVLEHLATGFQLRHEYEPLSAFNWNCGSMGETECNDILTSVWGAGALMPSGNYRLTHTAFTYRYRDEFGSPPCQTGCSSMDGELQLTFAGAATAVPTMSPLGTMLLCSLLGLVGYGKVRT